MKENVQFKEETKRLLKKLQGEETISNHVFLASSLGLGGEESRIPPSQSPSPPIPREPLCSLMFSLCFDSLQNSVKFLRY